MKDFFDKNITELKGVGDARAKLFSKLGVDTVGSLLCFYPRDYEDWSSWGALIDTKPSSSKASGNNASCGEPVFVKGRILTQ